MTELLVAGGCVMGLCALLLAMFRSLSREVLPVYCLTCQGDHYAGETCESEALTPHP